MGRYRRVWVVYRKELVDTLRDKRTLLAMVLVPIVLYPLLMIVLVEALRTETGRRQAEHYSICVPTEAHRTWLEGILAREDADREKQLAEYERAAEAAGEETVDPGAGLLAYLQADHVNIEVVGPDQSLWDLVTKEQYHVGILVDPPPNPDDPADATNRIVQLVYNDTSPRSEFVFTQLRRIMANEAERIVQTRLEEVPQGEALLTPLIESGVSTAGPDQQFAKILAMVVPFLLVTMTVTGAMYPAIDLTAGERERGTLETLAVSPVPVGQIVAGKFGVIVTIAMFSTTLNLASMTAMVHFSRLDQLASSAQPSRRAEALAVEEMIEKTAASQQADASTTTTPSEYHQHDYIQRRELLEQEAKEQQSSFLTTAAPVVLLSMIPFAVLFGAVMLAACSFARTFKEAQNYMMPVMMAAIIPAMIVAYMPTVDLEGMMLVIPVANVVVLMRELFLGRYDFPAITVSLLSTCLYAAAAVAVAARVYGNEAVLFSDVGSYKAMLRRRFFRPRTYPSTALALLMIAVIFPLNFYWQSYMLGVDSSGARFKWVISVAQVAIFAGPVLFAAWYLKIDPRRTFSLRMPRPHHAMGALLLAISIVPLSLLLQQFQQTWLPSSLTSNEALRQQAEIITGGSFITVLLAFAILPGICEEFVFRGFLLAGLRERLSTLKLVLAVGILFGVYHIYIEKIPIVSLMGILLAFVCLRTGSIYPAILIHIANNGLALIVSREAEGAWARSFYGLPDEDIAAGEIHFNLRTAGFLALFLIGLCLVATRRGEPHTLRDEKS